MACAQKDLKNYKVGKTHTIKLQVEDEYKSRCSFVSLQTTIENKSKFDRSF